MAKKRIHQIAKELDLASADILHQAKELGIEVKTASSGLTEEEEELVKLALAPVQDEKNVVQEVEEIKNEIEEEIVELPEEETAAGEADSAEGKGDAEAEGAGDATAGGKQHEFCWHDFCRPAAATIALIVATGHAMRASMER